MLVEDREAPAELSEVHRLHEPWEKQASTGLRAGSASAIDSYLRHGRVAGGSREEMLAACYQGWKTDVEAGQSSLMIAQDLASVTELNRLARADRVAAGHVASQGLDLSDGLVGGVGDVVVTRKNDRALRVSDGEWVRNRDRFVVVGTHPGGSMTVRRLEGDGQVALPSGYVAAQVELGYATSAHAAQGQTVSTAHALVSGAMTREVLYVAATRARESNRLYVDVEPEPAGADVAHGPGEVLEARDVLVAIADRRGAERSAHQAMASAWERATSFEQLVAEHQSLVAAEAAHHFGAVLDRSGLPADVLAQMRRSAEWDGLLGAMRLAADAGVDVEDVLAGLESAKWTRTDEDPAARLRAGLLRLARSAGRGPRSNGEMVAGLVPRAGPLDDKDIARAVREREDAIARRARDLAEVAVRTGAPWATPFGPPPARPGAAELWWDRLGVIATYRDRWRVTAPGTLGDLKEIGSLAQAAHRNRALQAGQEAARLAGRRSPTPAAGLGGSSVGAEPGVET